MRRSVRGVVASAAALLLLVPVLVLGGAGVASASSSAASSWSWVTLPTASASSTWSIKSTASGTLSTLEWDVQCSLSPTVSKFNGTNTSGTTAMPGTFNSGLTCSGSSGVIYSVTAIANGGPYSSPTTVASWQAEATNGTPCDSSTAGTGTGTQLTDAQLVAVAKAAGFSDASPQYQAKGLTWAVAIALAESGGRVDALNTSNSNGTTDRGLWQINSVHAAYDPTRLLTEAAYNGAAAFAISGGGQTFKPWSTFLNGSASAMYSRAAAAVAGSPFIGTVPCGGSNSGLPPPEPVAGTDYGSLSGQGGNAPSGISDCVPSGWDLLNPLAYVKTTFCMFKVVFVPTSATSDAWTSFKNSVSQRPPYSVVVAAHDFISGVISGVTGSASSTTMPGYIDTGTVNVGGAQLPTSINGLNGTGSEACAVNGSASGGGSLPSGDASGCTGTLDPYATVIRTIIRVGLWGGFLFLLWRRTNAALGAQIEGESDAGA